MGRVDSESFRMMAELVASTGGTFSFDGETSVIGSEHILRIIQDMGYDPSVTAEYRDGLYGLFNVELVNPPDFDASRFMLVPNHVSDFDALVLGLLHPRVRIVSKKDWTENVRLRAFLDMHYSMYGLDRSSTNSLRGLLVDSDNFFGDPGTGGPGCKGGLDGRHYLIFSQGTISDFNANAPERVSSIASRVSDRNGIPMVCVFLEQVSFDRPTRIVFGEPFTHGKGGGFGEAWLARMRRLQDTLVPPARRPVLTRKHSSNNRPGDEFF
ncbi:MAG: hypothetical protein FWE70_08440 [Oscillospiraceae bacterium]|nr:hypothetical protein [Oscillospiraceae bacterium]